VRIQFETEILIVTCNYMIDLLFGYKRWVTVCGHGQQLVLV